MIHEQILGGHCLRFETCGLDSLKNLGKHPCDLRRGSVCGKLWAPSVLPASSFRSLPKSIVESAMPATPVY